MKKVLSVFTIVLLCIVGAVYYCFFLDGRVFLKDNTENIVSHLKSVPTGEGFNLSAVCCPADSVYIVEPYNVEFFEQNSHLEIISKAKKSIENTTSHDGYCQLLFVKDNMVVSYAEIDRNIADFCDLDSCNDQHVNPKFSINTALYLDEHRKVHLK